MNPIDKINTVAGLNDSIPSGLHGLPKAKPVDPNRLCQMSKL